MIFDCEVDVEVPNILGRPYLTTGHDLVEKYEGKMKLRLKNE